MENCVAGVVDYDVNLTVWKSLQSLLDNILSESQLACIALQGNSLNTKVLYVGQALKSGGLVGIIMQNDLKTR